MPEITLTIPGTPPSGNNYKRARVVTPRGGKSFTSWYDTEAAKAWWATVERIAAGRTIRGDSYTVSYAVHVKNLAGADVDNYAKCVLDSLQKAGVIDNDKKVIDLHGYRRIDRANPRTVIVVRTEQEQLFEGGK